MNKKYVFIILLIFSNLLFSQKKIKVAVLPFSSVNEEEGDTISSIFANELSKRKVYTVLTRNSQMEKAMKELNFQRKGMTDENTIAEIGKALNAQYPNVENNDRKTALQFLESRSYTNEYSDEIIKILLEAGAR